MTLIKKPTVLILGGLILVVGLTAVWYRLRSHATSASVDTNLASSNSATSIAIAAQRPKATPESTSSTQRNWVVTRSTTATSASSIFLPPANTPIADVVLQLKAAAESGNPQAACRLGVELARCWHTDRLLNDPSFKGRSVNDEPAMLPLLDDQKLCAGVSTKDKNEAWRYLLQAAQAGNVAAMSKFALNPPLSTENFVSNIEGWQAVRDFGPQFLLTAIDRGDVRALYRAFFASFSGLGPGGESLLRKDAYQALVYGKALLPLVVPTDAGQIQKTISNLEITLSPSQVVGAELAAAKLRQASFSNVSSPTDVTGDSAFVEPLRCALN